MNRGYLIKGLAILKSTRRYLNTRGFSENEVMVKERSSHPSIHPSNLVWPTLMKQTYSMSYTWVSCPDKNLFSLL